MIVYILLFIIYNLNLNHYSFAYKNVQNVKIKNQIILCTVEE